MKSKLIWWSSAIAAVLSAAWVLLLAALVVRCRLAEQPFPVLAKFSPFRTHMLATDRMLGAFPVLAVLSLVFMGVAWYQLRSFGAIRAVVITIGASLVASLLVIGCNPGGYFSWFLS